MNKMLQDRENFKKKVEDLTDTYSEMVDSYSLEQYLWHYRTMLDVHKKTQTLAPERGLTLEKLAELENALAEFEEVYQTEKAEADKMPFSRDEAERLRTLFESVYEVSEPLEIAAPNEH